jgi:hypothetical protein
MMGTDWKLDGSYFEACNCDVVCPCVFTSAPTEGNCTALVGWHVDSGSMGDVSLDGLNVALAVYSPGNMFETPWQVALYIDNDADASQQEALTKIFGGQAGGHFADLGGFIGEVKGVSSMPISYEANGRSRSLRIEGIAEVAISGMEGQGGADIQVVNHPVAIAPGYPVVASKSDKLSYQDHGFSWEISGKTGFYSPFSYQGP